MKKSCVDCYMWPDGVHTKICTKCHEMRNWKPNLPENVNNIVSGNKQEVKMNSGIELKRGMDTDAFERLMEEQIERSRDVLCHKAKEYATNDRLHNFRVAADLQGCTPIQALSGMMAKHTVSVYDMCESGKAYPIDLWAEKITDSINYLLLLNALVREGEKHAQG